MCTPIRWKIPTNFRTSKTFFINSCWDRKRKRLPEFWPLWLNSRPKNWKKLYDMKKRNTLSCHLWVFCHCDKTKTPFRLKNSWNRQITFMPATVWQVLNMKCVQWPETEIYPQWIEKKSFNMKKRSLFPVFFGYFTKPLTKVRPNPNQGSAKQQLVNPFFLQLQPNHVMQLAVKSLQLLLFK